MLSQNSFINFCFFKISNNFNSIIILLSLLRQESVNILCLFLSVKTIECANNNPKRKNNSELIINVIVNKTKED